MNFATPTTDFTFKRLFGDAQRTNLPINFLNNLLERKEGNLITKIVFSDTANIPKAEGSKQSSVDISCTDQSGHQFIIEMQVAHEVYFLLRSQYYASFALSNQLKKGGSFEYLKPVIFVGIMKHDLFDYNQDPITHHFIIDSKTGKQSMEHLQFHYVELSKFHKKIEELETQMDKWLFFFKNATDLEMIPEQFKSSPDFTEAFHVVEQSLWTPEERKIYRKNLDEMSFYDRLQEGMVEKGERKKAEKIAIKLLKKGTNICDIADITELSVEQLELLFRDLKK